MPAARLSSVHSGAQPAEGARGLHLTLVARNKFGAAAKRTVGLTEAPTPAAPTTTVPPTTTPPTTVSAAPPTQMTGPGKFTFPVVDENGIASIQLNAVTQGAACPDANPFGGCSETPGQQQLDDVNISVCAGSSGATDIGFGSPGELSLDLNNATQASRDDVTDDSSVPTAFGTTRPWPRDRASPAISTLT